MCSNNHLATFLLINLNFSVNFSRIYSHLVNMIFKKLELIGPTKQGSYEIEKLHLVPWYFCDCMYIVCIP